MSSLMNWSSSSMGARVVMALVLPLLVLCSCRHAVQHACYDVVPLPKQMTIDSAIGFEVNSATPMILQDDDSVLQHNATFLCGYLESCFGIAPMVSVKCFFIHFLLF